MLAFALAVLLGADAAESDLLVRINTDARALGLVAVDPSQDRPGWCKTKPPAEVPIRLESTPQLPLLVDRDADQKRPGSIVQTRSIHLRDSACREFVFRIALREWTLDSEKAATSLVSELAASNHNRLLKRVHRIWRVGARVYFADSGAFMHWDRFVATMKKLGLVENACNHT